MSTTTFVTPENKSTSVNAEVTQKKENDSSGSDFKDNRPETVVQRKLVGLAQSGMPPEENSPDNSGNTTIQKKPNNTGLSDQLKSGIENLSGVSMDDVKVHRNSDKPSQLQAHAYAQGTDIHVAPGQEKHVPHEAWHVVQQKQGRVQPTKQLQSGVKINDDAGLEKEADVMGAKALQRKVDPSSGNPDLIDNEEAMMGAPFQLASNEVVQRAGGDGESGGFFSRLKKGFKKHGTWVMLIVEGLGHWALSAAAGAAAAAGALWNIITSICQGAIGVSKMIRAYYVRKVAFNPLSKLPGFFDKLIAGEGVAGAISAVTGGISVVTQGVSVVANLIPKIAGFLGSLIKVYRGANGANLSKKAKGGLVVVEALLGLFGNIERIFNAGADLVDGMTKIVSTGASKMVAAVKAGRGYKTFKEGAVAASETESPEEERARLSHVLATEDLDQNTREMILARLREGGAIELPHAQEAADKAREMGVATE